MRGVLSNANGINLFLRIFSRMSLHCKRSSSPIPRIRIWNISYQEKFQEELETFYDGQDSDEEEIPPRVSAGYEYKYGQGVR